MKGAREHTTATDGSVKIAATPATGGSRSEEKGGLPGMTHLIEEGAAFTDLMEATSLTEAAGQTVATGLSIATSAVAPVLHFPVIVIGAGQAGLSVGYHLSRLGIRFTILDAETRVGDVWRRRWDSLRLFTPAAYDGLDGMPFPASRGTFPTKDDMADYLESYARRFHLPVRNGVRVDSLTRQGDRYIVTAGPSRFTADNVVVAMSGYQKPVIPPFASELDRRILQLHAIDYRNPSQLRAGDVLLVGAGNSGADIAMELARLGRTAYLSGRSTGHIPFRIESFLGRNVLVHLTLRLLFHRVLTLDSPIGHKARPGFVTRGGPLIRVKPKDLARAGVKRIPRLAGVKNGLPLLDDGRTVDVPNVIWCTGFHPSFSWIHLPVFDAAGEPIHTRGVVNDEPGLYFVGLEFLYAPSSTMIHGVGRDARHIAGQIAARVGSAMRGR